MAEQAPYTEDQQPTSPFHPLMQFVGTLLAPEQLQAVLTRTELLNASIERLSDSRINRNFRAYFAGAYLSRLSYWGATLNDISQELFDSTDKASRAKATIVLKQLNGHLHSLIRVPTLHSNEEIHPTTGKKETRYYIRYASEPLITRERFLGFMGLPADDTIIAAESHYAQQLEAQRIVESEPDEHELVTPVSTVVPAPEIISGDKLDPAEPVKAIPEPSSIPKKPSPKEIKAKRQKKLTDSGLTANKETIETERVVEFLSSSALCDVATLGLLNLAEAWDTENDYRPIGTDTELAKTDLMFSLTFSAIKSRFKNWTITRNDTEPGEFYMINLRSPGEEPTYVTLELWETENHHYVRYLHYGPGPEITKRKRKREADLDFYIGVTKDTAIVFSWDTLGNQNVYEDTLDIPDPAQLSEIIRVFNNVY